MDNNKVLDGFLSQHQKSVNKFLFIKKASISPTQLCEYNEVSVRDGFSDNFISLQAKAAREKRENAEINGKTPLKREFHNFKISKNALRTLKRKIEWLHYFAKSRNITTYNNKNIYNFKMLFLTLTLPSKQMHATGYITKHCLNQFLTEMKQKNNLTNFVWRLEHQNNGNVHYHIVTDTYIDYYQALRVWNRIVEKEGYVSRYSEKFNKMNLSEYFSYTSQQSMPAVETDASNFYWSWSEVAKRYAKQKKDNFKNPNTIDVKVVTNGKRIGYYISKYFNKEKEENTNHNALDNEENSKTIRLWFCSRSLSKLKTISEYEELIDWKPSKILKNVKNVFVKVHDYCTIFYYDFITLPMQIKRLFSKIFLDYMKEVEYRPCE